MLEAALEAARSLGIPYNVAVVDAGGHLMAFVRQDDARIAGIELAIDKATTALCVQAATADLAAAAQPGAELYGIQQSNQGKTVIFGGGVPITRDGHVIGAIGVSAGTVEQDMKVVAAGAATFHA